MLKEEISYLEVNHDFGSNVPNILPSFWLTCNCQKTVEEAMGRATENGHHVASMSQEMKHKDSLIEELQEQLRHMRLQPTPSSSELSHELSDFNSCDGGLNGVVRSVREAMGLVKVSREKVNHVVWQSGCGE